jgi:predicted nucleotide-binding protein
MHKNKRVLMVDDDTFSSSLVLEDLKLEGFEVKTAATLSEAKGIINSNHFDAVILDIRLRVGKGPNIDEDEIFASREGFRSGLVLAKWIKRNYPDVFLIAYSNSAEKEVIDWFRQDGNGFLSKTKYMKSKDVVNYIRKVTYKAPLDVPKCFIVHGHDDTMKLDLKNYLQNTLKLPEPIILHEQPNLGRTIIEKFEDESENVDMVFVLLTLDDEFCKAHATNEQKRRARQNVIFEMGYFLGKLGRRHGRVILLHKGKIELPSDIAGLVYIDISNGIKAAGEEIRREVADFLPK